jgi:hypothetical protein
MLRKAKDLKGFKLGALDGEIGRTKEFYFDDETWTVRYLVADTGTWLTSHQVLISPFALREVDDASQILHVALTRKNIENCPPIGFDEPVSRQYERKYLAYYGWPLYWAGPALWGATAYPYYGHAVNPMDVLPENSEEHQGDPHLRSTSELHGYHIQARDKQIGRIEDFLLDDNWAIRYLIVDTRNFWPGKKVLLAPQWIEKVSWRESKVVADLPHDTIQGAPEYDDSKPITREYEQSLYGYYQRESYWTNDYIAEPTSHIH